MVCMCMYVLTSVCHQPVPQTWPVLVFRPTYLWNHPAAHHDDNNATVMAAYLNTPRWSFPFALSTEQPSIQLVHMTLVYGRAVLTVTISAAGKAVERYHLGGC
jgi:hypothetical protein